MRRPALIALILSLAAPAAAVAGMPVPVNETCAVGGEKFTWTTTASYSTWGARPDGKPYGSWNFPLDLPICPGNKLVMYREFSKDEITRLKGLIAEDDYKALAAAETPYYRAAWLERRLKPASDLAVFLLMQAGWEADDTPARRTRYLSELVTAVDAMPKAPASTDWLGLQVRAANAERELGRFEAAQARIAAIPFDAPPPKDDPEFADNREGMKAYAGKLAELAGRKETAVEPLDMLPPMVAVHACVDGELNGKPLPKAFCETEPLKSRVAKARADRAALEQKLKAN